MSWRSDSTGLALLLSRPVSEEELDRDRDPVEDRAEDRTEEPREPRG